MKRGQAYDSSATPLQQGRICSTGDEIYETQVRPQVEEGNRGKIVAIDIETGDFEVDASEIAACRSPDICVEKRSLLHFVRLATTSKMGSEMPKAGQKC